MQDVARALLDWQENGHRAALATVVASSGSAPRPNSAAMAVREGGLIVGSVSGGCVEGAVVEAARRAIQTGKSELLEFGPVSDAVLFEVGLSCGGQIRVWVERVELDEGWREFIRSVAQSRETRRWTRLDPENPGVLIQAESGIFGIEALRDDPEAAQAYYPGRDRLILVGAVHIAVHLVKFARELGFETIVVDPRQTFADLNRFPVPPDQLLCAWPDKALPELLDRAPVYVVTLSHDAKIDDPALAQALKNGASFVGALGSRKTQTAKRENLRTMGIADEDIDRIAGPVGLDIGSVTPEEIALSICAQLVQARRKVAV